MLYENVIKVFLLNGFEKIKTVNNLAYVIDERVVWFLSCLVLPIYWFSVFVHSVYQKVVLDAQNLRNFFIKKNTKKPPTQARSSVCLKTAMISVILGMKIKEGWLK